MNQWQNVGFIIKKLRINSRSRLLLSERRIDFLSMVAHAPPLQPVTFLAASDTKCVGKIMYGASGVAWDKNGGHRREKIANLLCTLSTWGARHHILGQLCFPGSQTFIPSLKTIHNVLMSTFAI